MIDLPVALMDAANRMKNVVRSLGAVCIGLAVVFGMTGCGSYNRLITLDQNVNKKWADVQSVYQRRADLIPNLVNTVQGAANFEKSTLTEVTNARASVGRVQLDPTKAPTDAAQLQQFQQAQGQLGNALSRLLLVSENYPQLRATEAFQNLQAQLEGTENRISVERNNFNGAVQEYNTAMQRFPTNMLNKMFGFKERPFFTSQPGSESAPAVNFGSFSSTPAAPAAPQVPATIGATAAPQVPAPMDATAAPTPALEATP
ncbi:LemA family protein [soil metagenome]